MGIFSFFKPKEKEQTLYFKKGQLYKIVGNKENWYDPRYIVSDGIKFDLADPLQINAVPIPEFGLIDTLSGYGSTGMLDYVLRMKAGNCFNRQEKSLCSALLWKSTELMFANKYCAWRQSDFEHIIDWHRKLGMENEAQKAKSYLQSEGLYIIEHKPATNKKTQTNCKSKEKSRAKMSVDEKEREIVKMTMDSDLLLLAGFPFVWNQKLKKNLDPGTHAYSYINISGENIDVVKKEIGSMNNIIGNDLKKYPRLPNLQIPTSSLVFSESKMQGHTKLVCCPITLTRKISKYPITLFFTTRLTPGVDSTHGELIYGQNGTVQKAKVYFWRSGRGYFFQYEASESGLELSKLEQV